MKGSEVVTAVKVEQTPIITMLLDKGFLCVYFMNLSAIATGLFIVNNYKAYGIKNGLDNENYLAILGSIAAIFNSIRFVWSLSTDHFSFKLVYGILVTM